MRVDEAVDIFLNAIKGEVSPETYRWYSDKLRPLRTLLGAMEVTTITIQDLRTCRAILMSRKERWTDHPRRPSAPGKLSPFTINGHIRAWRRFFRWLMEEGYVRANPAQRLKNLRTPDEEPKAASEEDIRLLLQAAKDSGPRNYAIVCFLVDTGARVKGAASLTLERLDVKRRRALVIEKFQKREKARAVYFGEITAGALKEWLAVRPKVEDSHVFLSSHGNGPLTPSGIYQVLKRLARNAGIEGRFNPHSLRHAFARRILQRGADLATLSQLMGHSSVEVTVRYYARWADDELAMLHAKYSRMADLIHPPSL